MGVNTEIEGTSECEVDAKSLEALGKRINQVNDYFRIIGPTTFVCFRSLWIFTT
jgi:hypothetical protein